MTDLPCARRVESNQPRDGSPDLRIVVPLRLPMCRSTQWQLCRVTPRLQWRHRDGLAPSSPSPASLHQKNALSEKLTVPLIPNSRAGDMSLAANFLHALLTDTK